jgi:hypothetical protein
MGMKRCVAMLLGILALGVVSVSQATPVYTGLTEADFGTGDTGRPGAAASTDAGYYLWTTGDTWSVRWTGNDNGDVSVYDWFGLINLVNLVDGSVTEMRFEAVDSLNVTNFFGTDLIYYTAVAGSGWDGFDFTIDSSNYSVIDFALGSTMFDSLIPSPEEVMGTNIFIGQDFNTPLVQVQDWGNGHIVQRFEVASVPEPSTLALMGIGLLGMGLGRRYKKC